MRDSPLLRLTLLVFGAACTPESTGAPDDTPPADIAQGGRAVPRWRALDLGSLGGPAALALDVSDQGVVVGYCTTETEPNTERACVWREPGVLPPQPLPSAHGGSQASGINNRGDIAGLISASDGLHAVLWPSTGGMVDLGRTFNNTLPSINAHGHMVWAVPPSVQGEATRVALFRDGQVVDLGVAVPNNGEGVGSPAGISDEGLIAVVGGTYWQRNSWRALPAPANATGMLIPHHVTPAGDIVGQLGGGVPANLGVWWPSPRRVRDLGTRIIAYDVDERGVLVGEGAIVSEGGVERWVPTTFTLKRGLDPLPLPETYQPFGRATRINGKGWIVGFAARPDAAQSGLLWNRALLWLPEAP